MEGVTGSIPVAPTTFFTVINGFLTITQVRVISLSVGEAAGKQPAASRLPQRNSFCLRSSRIATYAGLAEALNERGIETPQGSRWDPMAMKRSYRGASLNLSLRTP